MQYHQAREIAVQILQKLENFCERIDFAGDLAKEKEEVESIHIFCVPVEVGGKRVFGWRSGVANLGFMIDCDIIRGNHLKIMLPEAIILEIFIPAENYYYHLCTHEAEKSFVDRVNKLVEEKGNVPCETEYDYFSHLGISWQPVKDRM